MFVWRIMWEHDRVDVLQGIDIKKTNASKECDICHYWYILSKSLIMNNIVAMVAMI